MQVGDRIDLNGRLVQIDAVLGSDSFSYHEVKEVPVLGELLEEAPVVEKKTRKRKKA